MKAFFKWLARENFILSNPASEMELPRVHRRLPKHVLTADEVERILALGARHVDIGQGEQTWVVLADPEGNEFCVLRTRVG